MYTQFTAHAAFDYLFSLKIRNILVLWLYKLLIVNWIFNYIEQQNIINKYENKLVLAGSTLECMTQCNDLHSQCLSGVYDSANRTCRLFTEPLVELEEGNMEEMVYFMKTSSMTSKRINVILFW